MKKFLLFTIYNLLFTIHVSAQQLTQFLVLTQTDGTEVAKFQLSAKPVMSFSGPDLVVTCGDATLTTPMAGLITTFSDEEAPTAINSRFAVGSGSVAAGESPSPTMAFGAASVEGLRQGDTVTLYTADGKTLTSVEADSNGRASVSLSSLPKGIFILRTPTQSYKIINKGQ